MITLQRQFYRFMGCSFYEKCKSNRVRIHSIEMSYLSSKLRKWCIVLVHIKNIAYFIKNATKCQSCVSELNMYRKLLHMICIQLQSRTQITLFRACKIDVILSLSFFMRLYYTKMFVTIYRVTKVKQVVIY